VQRFRNNGRAAKINLERQAEVELSPESVARIVPTTASLRHLWTLAE
jgi:hypothetical protein